MAPGHATDQDAHLVEVKTGSEELFKGRFLHALRDTIRLPDGRSSDREYLVHPGAVMVIALLDDDRLVLERQFRYPIGQVMIEFPAGKLDPGETTLQCAQRELLEETGYRAREWARAGVIHPVIAYSTEFIEIWLARGLQAGPQQLDAGEFLEVFSATEQELLAWVRDGRVTDAKTLAGLLWLHQVRQGGWTLEWQAAPSGQEPIMGP